MPKLSLHVDELRVETFDPLPWQAARAGTVRANQGETDFSCPGNKTCGEKTCNSCDDTCSPPTCGGHDTCGGLSCEGTCPNDTCEGHTCDGGQSCGGSCKGWTCVSCPVVTCDCRDE